MRFSIAYLGKPFVPMVRKNKNVHDFMLLLVKCFDNKIVELTLRGVSSHFTTPGQLTTKKVFESPQYSELGVI